MSPSVVSIQAMKINKAEPRCFALGDSRLWHRIPARIVGLNLALDIALLRIEIANPPIRCLKRALEDGVQNVGRPTLLLHDFRRSAARNLERAGTSLPVAMKLTGHKTGAVYRRYAIVAESVPPGAGTKLAATLGTTRVTASHSDDDSVTAGRARSLSG